MQTIPVLAIDVFGYDFLGNPYAFHDEMREAGPVFFLERYGVFGMARHAEVTSALADHETFCSGRGVGLSDFALEEPWRPPSLLLETDPPTHDRTRGLMNKVVTPMVLKKLRQDWAAKAVGLVDELVAQGTVDLIRDLAEVFPLLIFPDTIGLKQEGRSNLLAYAAATFNAFGPRNSHFDRTAAEGAEAVAWVAEACRRENLAEDGWGMDVFRAADAGLCTPDEAERLVRSFLSAGVDTTVNGIGNMLAAFVDHPDQWARLRSEPSTSASKRAFEESLRWDGTVQTFFRTTTRDVTVEGELIPEGKKVVLFLAAANRDPRRWNEPEVFDIRRSASGHVGFGFGIHQCLGQMVARLEAEVMLEALLPRIEAIRPAGPAVRRINNTLHALASLPAQLVPTAPASEIAA